MPGRETVAIIGARRSAALRQRLASELVAARLAAGASRRELARRVGVSEARIARAERGDSATLTVDLTARMAPVVGLQLAASLFSSGDPVRDRGHLALLARLRARIDPTLRWRVEVPIPIAGDRRSGDAVIAASGEAWDALVEAETRIDDVQLVERRSAAKQRDLGATRLILLLADTTHNRGTLRLHPELRDRFPIDTRVCLRRLHHGLDPGGDCLVIL
jgi:transcriptional regulator with XRE-family HTH domain